MHIQPSLQVIMGANISWVFWECSNIRRLTHSVYLQGKERMFNQISFLIFLPFVSPRVTNLAHPAQILFVRLVTERRMLRTGKPEVSPFHQRAERWWLSDVKYSTTLWFSLCSCPRLLCLLPFYLWQESRSGWFISICAFLLWDRERERTASSDFFFFSSFFFFFTAT